MRALTPPQATALLAAERVVVHRVEIKNKVGAWVDYTPRVKSISGDESVDAPIASCTVQLRRTLNAQSLSPMRGDSPLNVGGSAIDAGREIRVSVAVMPVGVTIDATDYRVVFWGRIDRFDFGPQVMTLNCRSMLGKLVDLWVKDETVYNDPDPVRQDTTIQNILDNWAPGWTLIVPTAPTFMVNKWKQAPDSVWNVIRTVAALNGSDLKLLYASNGNPMLVLVMPDRDVSATVYTFDKDHYFDVSELSVDLTFIRNQIRVTYYDTAAKAPAHVDVEDAASITRFGPQWAEVVQGNESPINTDTEATDLANIALADLSFPPASHVIDMPYFWPCEINDFYLFSANWIHYDDDQKLAVTGHHWEISDNKKRSYLSVREKPLGFYRTWIRSSQQRPEIIEAEATLSIIEVKEIARTASTVTYSIHCGDDVGEIWIYNILAEQPVAVDPWPDDLTLPDDILTPVNNLATLALDLPTPGYIRYVQIEPRSSGVDASGPIRRMVLFPPNEDPDKIVSLQVTVNDDDGSASITIYVPDRAQSVRFAYNVADSPTEPTDAAVEAATVHTITGYASFALAAATVGLDQGIIVRACAYLQNDGTGTGGVTDHGPIVKATDRRDRPPVSLEITTESKTSTDGTFGVTVRDAGGFATALYVRKQLGGAAPGSWTLKTATPTNGTEYTETVALMEGHTVSVEFRLDYTKNGAAGAVPQKSHGFDMGRIPNLVIIPRLDENTSSASAVVVGDVDLASVKIAASKSGVPTDATVRAATAKNGRTLTPADFGALVSSLVPGDIVYFKAFGYSDVNGGGNESSASVQAQMQYGTIAPELKVTTRSVSGSVGTGGATVVDPAGRSNNLYVQTRSGAGAVSSWSQVSAAPQNNTEYQSTVTLVGQHPSDIVFRLQYTLNGQTMYAFAYITGMDIGMLPNIAVNAVIDGSGNVSATVVGDPDEASIKIAGASGAYPADATVRAATALNGRSFSSATIGTLVTIAEGVRAYIKAFGYSGTGGSGVESVAALAEIVRGTGGAPPETPPSINNIQLTQHVTANPGHPDPYLTYSCTLQAGQSVDCYFLKTCSDDTTDMITAFTGGGASQTNWHIGGNGTGDSYNKPGNGIDAYIDIQAKLQIMESGSPVATQYSNVVRFYYTIPI